MIPRRLLAWFDQHGRKELPWQIDKTPYRVWVSEIMLQQTQVSTVIPYYLKFMSCFSTIEKLAAAADDEVLHLWAGLGYYSRARNLHKAARMVVSEFNGQFPDTLESLITLPGIGQSTAAAILAIAFEKRATILDGNVKRVMARLHGVSDPINERATEELLWDFAEQYTPKKRVADYTQAIMDLGATVCTRSKPQCHACPLSGSCIALQTGVTDQLPVKKAGKRIPTKAATFLLIEHEKKILLYKRPPSGIWGGLWSLPELVGKADEAKIREFLRREFGLNAHKQQPLDPFRHTFSHYHLNIHPVHVTLRKSKSPGKIMEATEQIWYNTDKPDNVGLPKPIAKILRGYK